MRSVIGSYHKVSVRHLDAYLDELKWRFNNRDNPYLFKDTLLKLIDPRNLPYQTLVSWRPVLVVWLRFWLPSDKPLLRGI